MMSLKEYKLLTTQTDYESKELEKYDQPVLEQHLFSHHEEIQSPKEVSTWKMVLNLLNYMEGVGFLAIPYAVREGGITALLGICLLPFILGYTANLLSQCIDEKDETGQIVKRRLTYQEIAKDSWAPLEMVVWITNNLVLLMADISYIVVSSSLMSQQFPQVPFSPWACLGTLIVLPTVFLKSFSQIAWLSLLSLVVLIAVIIIMLGFEAPMLFHSEFSSIFFWDTRGVFVSMSILISSYSFHHIIVAVAVDVRDQSKFKLAVALNYFFAAITKVVFGLSGFLAFRGDTEEVVLNNLPPGITSKLVAIFFTFNVLLTYAIPYLVIVRNIEELSFYQKICDKINPLICDALLRFILSTLVLILAIGVGQHFALVTALLGTTTSLDSIFFPALFQLVLRFKKLTKLQIFVDCLLMVLFVALFWLTLVSTIISW